MARSEHDAYYEGSEFYAELFDYWGTRMPREVALEELAVHGTSLEDLHPADRKLFRAQSVPTLGLVQALGY